MSMKESSEKKMIKIEFCTEDPIKADHMYRLLRSNATKGDVISIDSNHTDYPWPLESDLDGD